MANPFIDDEAQVSESDDEEEGEEDVEGKDIQVYGFYVIS